MTVYLETVIGVNFLADFALLWLTGRCLGLATRYGRLAAAALAGAAYALLSLVRPAGPAFTLVGKMLAAAGMLWIAYRLRGVRQWGSAVSVFVVASAAMAGVTIALNLPGGAMAAGAAIVLPSRAPSSLPVAFAAAAAAAYGLAAGLKRVVRLGSIRVGVTVSAGGRSASFVALVDTGNELRDPLTGRPAVVVELGAVRELLPPAFQALCCAGLGPESLAGPDGTLSGGDWQARLRFVPYRSLGRSRGGVLVGFAPDLVLVSLPGRGAEKVDVIVAVSPEQLAGHGAFQAILPASAVQQGGQSAA